MSGSVARWDDLRAAALNDFGVRAFAIEKATCVTSQAREGIARLYIVVFPDRNTSLPPSGDNREHDSVVPDAPQRIRSSPWAPVSPLFQTRDQRPVTRLLPTGSRKELEAS